MCAGQEGADELAVEMADFAAHGYTAVTIGKLPGGQEAGGI